jgi:type I restriction enzyme S subunit
MREVMEVIESGFKETEIGLIPEDWEVVRLGKVAEISSGGSAPQGKEYFEGNNPFIRVQHLDNDNYKIKGCDYVTDEAVKKYKLKLYPKDTIIFPKSGASIYLEKRAKLPFDAYIVSHLMAVRSKSRLLLQDYLFFNLVSKKLSKDKADNYPTLNISEVSQILIPFPPLEEQKAIADILSTVQNAIEKTEKVINATKQLKKSMMKHLFTYGAVAVDEIDKVKLKESEIGLIPEDWEVVRLENFMEGFTPNKKLKQSDYKAIGKFPVIDQSQEYVAGFYDDETMVFDKDLPVILFGDHTRIIKYVDFPFICGADGLKIIIPKENFHRKYFYYALLNLNIPSRGYNRHFKILKEKLIPLPPLDEQQKIANILTTIDQKIQAEEKKKTALQNLFKTLLQQLMTGKIRVKKAKT